jgi:hypothetical protein
MMTARDGCEADWGVFRLADEDVAWWVWLVPMTERLQHEAEDCG